MKLRATLQTQSSSMLCAFAFAITIVIGLGFACALVLTAASIPAQAAADASWRERIEPTLLELLDQPSSRFMTSSSAVSSQLFELDPDLLARGRVRLQIDVGPSGLPAEELRANLLARPAALEWEGAVGGWAQVTVDIADLPAIAQTPGVFYVMRPPVGVPLVESQGVAEIGAAAYQDAGFGGQGVALGVLDVGFAGAVALLGTELPSGTKMRSFYGSTSGDGDITGEGTTHGTSCAEIVHDVAPDASLYLANANTAVELTAAADWLISQGVAVISHSLGWFFGPGDGTGDFDAIISRVIDQNVIWVNAAGNQAEAYWEGDFTDGNGDGLHEFATGGDNTITTLTSAGGESFVLVLTWNRWPYSTDLSFDIEIQENGIPAVTSATGYAGFPYAYRDLVFTPSGANSRIDILIRCTGGTPGAHLRLFRLDGESFPEYDVPDGSIVLPADIPRVISVGAYRVRQDFLEEFSSRGPTQSGVHKPEICGPDGVSTASDAPQLFGGTSASCPHVAGAVAQLLAITPEAGFFDFRWDLADVRSLLARAAAPADFPDPNGTVWGLVRLPELAGDKASDLTINTPVPSFAPYRWVLPDLGPGPVDARIYDLSGRMIASLQPARNSQAGLEIAWDGRDRSGQPAPAGQLMIVARGSARRASGRLLVIR